MGIQQLQASIFNNPIHWREVLTLSRQRGKWLWRGLFAITIFLLVAPILWGFKAPFIQHLETAVGFLVIANLVLYPLLALRAITTAHDSVARERRDQTWDLLMLTGVGAWQIILGKWLGTMHYLLRSFAWLYLLRLGTLLWYVAQISISTQIRAQAQPPAGQWSYELYRAARDSFFLSDVNFADNSWAYVVLAVLVFTLLELAFSSALGVALAFFNLKGRAGSGLAVAARIVLPLVLFFSLMLGAGLIRFDNQPARYYSDATSTVLLTYSGVLIDNGMLSMATMLDDGYQAAGDLRPDDSVAFGHSLGMLTYLSLTLVALGAGRVAAGYAGVSATALPGMMHKRKVKRTTRAIDSSQIVEEPRVLMPTPGTSDAFGVPHAATYQAEVYYYQRRLGRMFLRLTHPQQEPLYVQLSGVAYIEAPAFWKGADFRTASQVEFEAFVEARSLRLNSFTSGQSRMYVLDGAGVRIVASHAQILTELPNNI